MLVVIVACCMTTNLLMWKHCLGFSCLINALFCAFQLYIQHCLLFSSVWFLFVLSINLLTQCYFFFSMVLIDLQFFRREVSWGLGWPSASYTWVCSIHYSGIPVMGIAAAKKKPRGCHPFPASCTIPCLGSGAPDGSLLIMLRKYPSKRHLVLSDCSCGSEEQASCCQTGIVHVQSPASTAEEKQETFCLQSTNFNNPCTRRELHAFPSLVVFITQPYCAVSPN